MCSAESNQPWWNLFTFLFGKNSNDACLMFHVFMLKQGSSTLSSSLTPGAHSHSSATPKSIFLSLHSLIFCCCYRMRLGKMAKKKKKKIFCWQKKKNCSRSRRKSLKVSLLFSFRRRAKSATEKWNKNTTTTEAAKRREKMKKIGKFAFSFLVDNAMTRLLCSSAKFSPAIKFHVPFFSRYHVDEIRRMLMAQVTATTKRHGYWLDYDMKIWRELKMISH